MPSAQDSLRSDGARRFFTCWDGIRVFTCWDGIRGDGLVPDRQAFDPVAIRDLMPSITILEIWSPERIVSRLAGTGVDPTGKNWLDLQRPELRDGYVRVIEAQTKQPCGRRTVMRSRNAKGVVSRAEALALPMFHAASGHDMIVSYFATLDILAYEGGDYQVLDFEETHWIDIGAGVPAWR